MQVFNLTIVLPGAKFSKIVDFCHKTGGFYAF